MYAKLDLAANGTKITSYSLKRNLITFGFGKIS